MVTAKLLVHHVPCKSSSTGEFSAIFNEAMHPYCAVPTDLLAKEDKEPYYNDSLAFSKTTDRIHLTE